MTASFLINFHYNEITVKDYSLKKKKIAFCVPQKKESHELYLGMNNDGIFISGWYISLKTYKIFEDAFSLDFSCFVAGNQEEQMNNPE